MSGETIDIFRYDQQACLWNTFSDSEWLFYSKNRSVTATECAQACYNNTRCTGFELSQSGYDDSPYCAFWFDGACYVPDNYVELCYDVTTYSLVSRQPPFEWNDFFNGYWFYVMMFGIILMTCAVACCVCRRQAITVSRSSRAVTVVEKVESDDEPVVVARVV